MEESNSKTSNQPRELLKAQAHIWSQIYSFHNSMALKCAIQLGIPDAIHKHGQPMTLTKLSNALSLPPNKTSALCRLMRFLIHSNFFSPSTSVDGEVAYSITTNSQMLLRDHPFTHAEPLLVLVEPTMVNPAQYLETWFRTKDESITPFHLANDGMSIWDHSNREPKFSGSFNELMGSDSRLVGWLLVIDEEFKKVGLFEGVRSLVDVGGGTGTLAKVIAEAYPEIKCTVLDLPHATRGMEGNGRNLFYVEGDMFEAIPPADALIFKWIFHDWSDEKCIKILERCKEAIPSKNQGGKLIIIDNVVDETLSNTPKHMMGAKLILDMQMMSVTGGKERTEEEWKQLFLTAGFADYKVFPTPGMMSIILVYPA